MGTDVHVVVVGGPDGSLQWAADRIAGLERRWSRFLSGSELSRLNAAAGRPVVVSAETFALVSAAVDAWRRSRGLFDPTVLTSLHSLGYDRSFDTIESTGPQAPPPSRSPGCAGIVLSPKPRLVMLPAGVGLDLGGIAKGLAADWVVEELLDHCAGACVNVGGDVRVSGDAPDSGGWVVAVEHPLEVGTDVVRLALADGAVCTSSRLRRRWRRNGTSQHHIIDPRTGRPSDTSLVAATVVAGTAVEAEVLCKVALLDGPSAAEPLLEETGGVAVVVDEDGRVVHVGDTMRYAA